ncbi:Dual 3',5'-Cyclic-Amp And -Gmp Phosphodiesterase 11A [Manis pentadactyla]|nr:Dual 3',5'-Cyclic-Amp And -Gmp Phosphodiesterase 11A [Manis pentadactyla]
MAILALKYPGPRGWLQGQTPPGGADEPRLCKPPPAGPAFSSGTFRAYGAGTGARLHGPGRTEATNTRRTSSSTCSSRELFPPTSSPPLRAFILPMRVCETKGDIPVSSLSVKTLLTKPSAHRHTTGARLTPPARFLLLLSENLGELATHLDSRLLSVDF